MKVNVTYTSTKHYDRTCIMQWVWHFHRYKNIRGFIFRFFGIYFNVREKNAFEKLVAIAHSKADMKS